MSLIGHIIISNQILSLSLDSDQQFHLFLQFNLYRQSK